ncbi:unnamed protein product [Ophioblennius macclurei]
MESAWPLPPRAPFVLFLWTVVAVARAWVAPPTNVTLHCQDMKNVLKWDYSQMTPGLRFRVDIGAFFNQNAEGFRNKVWVDSPTTEADLSFLSDPGEAYFLTVTAVAGNNESAPSPSSDGITFSYDQGQEVTDKCFVNFPPVNVTAQPDNNVQLRFQHPWLMLHLQMRSNRETPSRTKKSRDLDLESDLPVFEYSVFVIDQHGRQHKYSCYDPVCEEKLPVDPQKKEHCLKFNGDLVQMRVNGDQPYCARPMEMPPAHAHVYTYVFVMLGLCAAALAIVLSMAYCKKTKPSSKTPRPLNVSATHPRTLAVEPDAVVLVQEVIDSPDSSLKATDSEDCPWSASPDDRPSDYDGRMRLGLPLGDEGGSDSPDGGEESSDYRHGASLDQDEVPFSYERRGVPVEMEPGDVLVGYRG